VQRHCSTPPEKPLVNNLGVMTGSLRILFTTVCEWNPLSRTESNDTH
jgi:hypothetical protein